MSSNDLTRHFDGLPLAVISNKANTCKSRCGPSELMDVGRWLMQVLTLNATAGHVPMAI